MPYNVIWCIVGHHTPLEINGGHAGIRRRHWGGLPGLPMAICYPQAHFTLIDSIGKKLGWCDLVARLDLKMSRPSKCERNS